MPARLKVFVRDMEFRYQPMIGIVRCSRPRRFSKPVGLVSKERSRILPCMTAS